MVDPRSESLEELTIDLTIDNVVANESAPEFAFAEITLGAILLMVTFRCRENSESLDALSISVISSVLLRNDAEENLHTLIPMIIELHKTLDARRTIAEMGLEDGWRDYSWENECQRLERKQLDGDFWLDVVAKEFVTDAYIERKAAVEPKPLLFKQFEWGSFWRARLRP